MEYNTTGVMRSPFSPRVRQSIGGRRPIGLGSAKKNQSKFMQSVEQTGDVIYKTQMSSIDTYGLPLPVMVTETLTFASGDVSVRMSPCGWCWIVAGRRVLAWPREAAVAPAAPTARELTLPQTDLAHKAELVVLFYEDGAQMPSCIGVSPEGVVRYWASVGAEGAYTDVSCELAGQECDRLAAASRGLLLATTTCTLVKITTTNEGRPTVVCTTLRPPSGWLGGIGRRVSLLFFGSMPAHADTKLVGVVVLPPTSSMENGEAVEEDECYALVAGGPLLQLWCGAEVHEHHLRRPLSEAFARSHLAPQGDLNSLEIMALDVHAHGARGLLLLLAAVNVARSPDMRYALAHISVEQRERVRVVSLCALHVPRDDEPPRCLPLPTRPLLYTSTYVACFSPTATEKAEFVDVSAESDRILGAALCDGLPLLFSRKHGVLLLRAAEPGPPHHTPSICDSPMGSPCPSDMYDSNLSLYEIDPHEVSAMSTDALGKLKSAFLFHARGDASSAARLLAELFPRAEPHSDAPLDRTALALAQDMLDDAPAGDPRWKLRGGGATRVALGSSAALQAAAQLRDKQRAFALFLDFLRAHGLWRRLGSVTAGADAEGAVSTQYALCELGERLAAARALQRLHQDGAHLVDAALHRVTGAAESEGADSAEGEEAEVLQALRGGALSAADVCFRRVTRIGRVLRALAELPPPAHDARAAAHHALHALQALTTALGEMHKARAPGPRPAPPLGPRALLSALAALHRRAVTECAHKCPDVSLRAQLLEAAGALADLLLSEAEPLRRATRTLHLYERMRSDTIQPYLQAGQTERAAVLAEKFQDFELLIEMCVQRGDTQRLHEYIDKYSDEGMAEKAFAWLASRGGAQCAMLLRELAPRAGERLAAWLAAVPDRLPLRALHALLAGDAPLAARLYAELAERETQYVARMRTAASVAKLCALAADEQQRSDSWRRAEERLALAEQHDALPRELRLHHGLDDDGDGGRVLDPEEIVQMYIDSSSRSLTEYDYKKALDLTDFVDDMERRDELRLRVWCACIRRDDWSVCRVDAPATEMQDKMFFRLLDLVHLMGGDLELLLPPVEDILTAPELAELVSDPRFHFIIKYGYEQVDATRNDHMIEAS